MPPQHQFDSAKVLKELQDHNSFFDEVVDMLPAKLYVSGNTGDEKYNPKFWQGQHKESKEARRARNKASKQNKFDPVLAETTLEAKERKSEEDAMVDDDSSDDENDDMAMEDEEEQGIENTSNKSKVEGGKKAGSWSVENGDDDDKKEEKQNDPVVTSESNGLVVQGNGNLSRIEALRAKLHAKIAEKRALRPEAEENSAIISKRAARRAEKKRRYDAKMKSNNKFPKVNEGSKRAKIEMGGTKLNTGTKADSKTGDDLLGIDYGAIAGLKQVQSFKDNKSLANTNGKNRKSLDTLLALAQKKKDRLKELKAGTDEDKEKAKRIDWGDTLKAATGEKTNSDPSLLKKAIKRRAKQKTKSGEAWKVRIDSVKDKMDERQKIRSHNIDKRKLGGAIGANLSNKRIEESEAEKEAAGDGKKRARLGPHSTKGRAGFEGKKQEFINGKGKKKSEQ
eukprot:CAMPEP_0197824984 /NCGR_PEP_ID=MMETSP1437-20131217/2145_1 /TAXON_ID=49252 ORGANISM="Eucampia antarctica, Strain CCMP1452" /NCGR_SAMPLE_ID=MMETSP1437 /ASSEMBLY_ACC=CAM_ASM_001096 /LENGTH=450 /DNA_ID=CAMNT_0043424809 /DNA_START=204 /DNA_END=1556 /DNA_ORIENTATION=-